MLSYVSAYVANQLSGACMPRPDFKVGENNPNVLLVGACPGEDEEKKKQALFWPSWKEPRSHAAKIT
jgi:hypothetical protein